MKYFGDMSNIKFNYFYRDGFNYKTHSYVIFDNPNIIEIFELEAFVRSKLIYDSWFYAEQWKIPELVSTFFEYKFDPTWHEFESVEYTDEPANSTLTEFIGILRSS
jgi:hypothetical protein